MNWPEKSKNAEIYVKTAILACAMKAPKIRGLNEFLI